MPKSFRVRASLVEATFLSASTNDRCGFRVDRLRPAIPFRFFHDTSTPLRLPLRAYATPPLCYGSWRYIASTVTNYLHTSIPTLPPTPPAMPTVSGSFPLQCAPKPPLAIPSRRCRSAALPPALHAWAILSATFLPPIEEEAAYIPSPRHVPSRH